MSGVQNTRNTAGQDFAKLYADTMKNTDGWISDAATRHTTFNVFGLKVPRTFIFTDEEKMNREIQNLQDLRRQVQQSLDKVANMGNDMLKRLQGYQ